MLEITNLHKKYKDFTLDHISFRLPKGFIMGLVGKKRSRKVNDDKEHYEHAGF